MKSGVLTSAGVGVLDFFDALRVVRFVVFLVPPTVLGFEAVAAADRRP